MKSILLVEDDPYITDIYSAKLKEAGLLVTIAVSGEECLRKLKEKKPDLLLLDIVLPNVDGWEVLRKIKAEDKSFTFGQGQKVKDKFKNLKVVILSNLGQKEEIEKGLKLGATKYLIKAHFTPSEIVKEIKKILKLGN